MQLRQVIDSCWKDDYYSKLKPLFKAVHAFIIWLICKRRNVIRNCNSTFKHILIIGVNR